MKKHFYPHFIIYYFLLFAILFSFQGANAHLHVDLDEVRDPQKKELLHTLRLQGLSESARVRLSEWTIKNNNDIYFKGHIHHQDLNRGGSFQKFEGFLNSSIKKYEIKKEVFIPLSQMKFVVRAYIKNLITEVEAPEQGIRVILPLGGPGIDHGITPRAYKGSVFMTPFFQGHLMRSKTVARRCEPAHYKCKPFIRLIPHGVDHSLYGFHTEPFKDEFERGFVSAGCFRLPDEDLWELFQFVRFGFLSQIPFEMIEGDPRLNQAHPHPVINDSYEGIYRWRLKEGRIVFNSKRIHQVPPLDQIRFQTLEEVKRIDLETRRRIGRSDSQHFNRP
ncbi:MAG: hypothetical protein ACK5V3_11495 [Bdellovibrionales bacterium]